LRFNYSGYFYNLEKEAFNSVRNEFLKNFKISNNFILFIHSVSEENSRVLNYKNFKKNYPTDVLTIPLFSNLDEIKMLNNNNNEVLGDLFLNRILIKNNAIRYGKKLVEEYQLVLLHGLLHLIGYSHNDQDTLSRIEEKILKKVWNE
jgi:probable rRNA maturation factor